MRSRFLPVVVVVLAIMVTSFALSQKESNNTPLDQLKVAAHQNGYWSHENTVVLPWSSFETSDLCKWQQFSEHEMHLVASGGMYQIAVVFSDEGMEIYGVDIVWHGQRSTVSFPYHLNKDETVAFVKKSITKMELITEHHKTWDGML